MTTQAMLQERLCEPYGVGCVDGPGYTLDLKFVCKVLPVLYPNYECSDETAEKVR